MALRIPTFLVPIRFATANPTLRVTLGTSQTLTLSVSTGEDYWLSGDGSTTTGARDLAERLQTCLRTHGGTGAASFTVTVSEDNVLTVTCSNAFALLWADGATTLSPTVFGWTAANTSSATSQVAPNQTKGVWSPGVPWAFDSGDDATIIGAYTETEDGGSRGSLTNVLYDRTIRFTLLQGARVKTEFADATKPYGAFEYSWTTGGWGQGARVRVYADRSSRTSTSYAVYRRRSISRPWARMDAVSTLRWQLELELRRAS